MCFSANIWKENEINDWLNDCEGLVQSASIVTVSMSYGYSGVEEDTERLTKKVINLFYKWRSS